MDKRSFPRFKKTYPATLKIKGSESSLSCQTIDISRGGIAVKLKKPLPESSAASLYLNSIPDYPAITTKAQSVWSKPLSDGTFQYGLRFTELEEDSSLLLRRLLGYEVDHIVTASYLPEQIVTNEDIVKMGFKGSVASFTMIMILNSVQDYHENCEVTSITLTDIRLSLEEALLKLKPKFDKIGAKITVDIAQDLPKIEAYPTFSNLFFNLLTNCYFGLAGKKTRFLDIKAYQTKDSQRPIEIGITDTGGDMVKMMQKDAISSGGEYFPERSNIGGVNFFLARHIIDDHRGELLVSTNPPPGPGDYPGAIFTIKLPLTQPKS